jgi:hypothetical protein
VHAEELQEVTHVFDFELGTKLRLERCKPSGIIACCGNVVHVECDHSENVTSAENVDTRVREALLPPVVDKPGTKEHVELARGLFQSVEAVSEMTHIRRAIAEAKRLADVHVLFDGSVEQRSVDTKLTQFKIACGRNGEE